jgi:hypothetical protein
MLQGEKINTKMYIILKGKVALARPIANKSIPLEEINMAGTF